jgi:sulfoxide reductase catalytic subunit YedY
MDLYQAPPPSEITPERTYWTRRRFLRVGAATLATGFAAGNGHGAARSLYPQGGREFLSDADTPNTWAEITGYNNYYEFSTDKRAVRILAQEFVTAPWSIQIEGEVSRPKTLDIDDLRRLPQQERVYRLRCIEGWSMVIPWNGIPLCDLIQLVEPTSRARFVQFSGLKDPARLPGQRTSTLPWPYQEGLRMDEAMHPLSFLALGLYGKALPAQNGAPARLVVPWKYGFKSIKAIARIRFTEEQPATTWSTAVPSEYGFFANVNPGVPHPRWSQEREVRIGQLAKIRTLPFNGYASEVAALYSGLDLRRHF